MQEQKLRPGEKIDMPVFFYVDPEFATDPRMKRINHLTLSYTFFKVRVPTGTCPSGKLRCAVITMAVIDLLASQVLEEDVEDVPYEGPAVANLCDGDIPAAATA